MLSLEEQIAGIKNQIVEAKEDQQRFLASYQKTESKNDKWLYEITQQKINMLNLARIEKEIELDKLS